MTEDAIRTALTPLRAHEPQPDVEGLVERGRRARRASKGRRAGGAAVAGALAVAVAVAGLPGGGEQPTARGVLSAAAAAAAEQPAADPTGIRYVRVDYRILLQPHGGGEADRFEFVRRGEQWVRLDGSGRIEMGAGTFADLEGRSRPAPAGAPEVGPDASDERRVDFDHIDVANLPTDPDAVERELDAAVRRTYEERARKPADEAIVPLLVTRAAIDLLAYASIAREQRGAVLEVLAGMPGARAVDDDEVELEAAGFSGERIVTRLVVDPDTGALVARTEQPGDEAFPGADRVAQTWRFVESRDVEAVGARP